MMSQTIDISNVDWGYLRFQFLTEQILVLKPGVVVLCFINTKHRVQSTSLLWNTGFSMFHYYGTLVLQYVSLLRNTGFSMLHDYAKTVSVCFIITEHQYQYVSILRNTGLHYYETPVLVYFIIMEYRFQYVSLLRNTGFRYMFH